MTFSHIGHFKGIRLCVGGQHCEKVPLPHGGIPEKYGLGLVVEPTKFTRIELQEIQKYSVVSNTDIFGCAKHMKCAEPHKGWTLVASPGVTGW